MPDASAPRRTRPEPKPGILGITPYKPGKSQVEGVANPVKLSSNENILGFSEHARAAYAAAVERMNLYPDGRAEALRHAVADYFHLEPERLVFGDGTDEVLHLLNQVFLEPGDNIVMGQYGFGAYSIGARACQAEVRMAAEPHHRLTTDAVLKEVDDCTRLVFITQPANPTGTFMTRDELSELHAALPGDVVLVIDGAYAEFADDPRFDDGLELARTAENVVVTRTFSKIYGLAGLRCGVAIARKDLLDRMLGYGDNVMPMPAVLAAEASLMDEALVPARKAYNDRAREDLYAFFRASKLDYIPSEANFTMVRVGKPAGAVIKALADRRVYVSGPRGIGEDWLRVSFGAPNEMDAFKTALTAVLAA